MVTRSKLRLGLAAEKGVDFAKLKQKRKQKDALKKKAPNGGAAQSKISEDHDSQDEEEHLNESDEESNEEVAQVSDL